MDTKLLSIDANLINAFHYIMENEQYSRRRWKRFRIFFFSYMFGCVCVDDLFNIFYNENQNKTDTTNEELRKAYRTLLSYRSANTERGMEKIKEGYYTLSDTGTRLLFDELKACNFYEEDFWDRFFLNRNRKLLSVAHSCNTGNMVLSVYRTLHCLFLVEPMIGLDGTILSYEAGAKQANCLLPDAYVPEDTTGERYYLEADSSKERRSSNLIPKFSRYAATLSSRSVAPYTSTIQFSIWSDREGMIKDPKSVTLLSDLRSSYGLIKQLSCETISFENWISALSSYQGDNEYYRSLSDRIQALHIRDNTGLQNIDALSQLSVIESHQTKSFCTRANYIHQSARETPGINNLIFSGVRFVYLPLSVTDMLLKYIYLEAYNYSSKIEQIFHEELADFNVLSYQKIIHLSDEITGQSYSFRNGYTCAFGDNSFNIIIENISHDFSGRDRVCNLLNNSSVLPSKQFIILLLFLSPPDLDSLLDNIRNTTNQKYVYAISYYDFFMGKSVMRLGV